LYALFIIALLKIVVKKTAVQLDVKTTLVSPVFDKRFAANLWTMGLSKAYRNDDNVIIRLYIRSRKMVVSYAVPFGKKRQLDRLHSNFDPAFSGRKYSLFMSARRVV
jgi:hypothetical protein